jgi:hypothetical protein
MKKALILAPLWPLFYSLASCEKIDQLLTFYTSTTART